MNSAREIVQIINQRGLHARASAKFVNAVSELPVNIDVTVVKDGMEVAGGSILGLMMLGVSKGDTMEICVTGDDPGSALCILIDLVQSGFGED